MSFSLKRTRTSMGQRTMGGVSKKPRLARAVRRIIRNSEEQKAFGTILSLPSGATGITTAGAIYDLCAVPQGDTDAMRNGNQLQADYLDFRIRYTQSAATVASCIRQIIFQWFPDNAVTFPTVAQILEAATIVGSYNWDNQQLFKVLSDKSFVVDDLHPITNNSFVRVKPTRPKIRFGPAVNTGMNHIHVLYISDDGANPYPGLSNQARLYFRDS